MLFKRLSNFHHYFRTRAIPHEKIDKNRFLTHLWENETGIEQVSFKTKIINTRTHTGQQNEDR